MGFTCTVCGEYHEERPLDVTAQVPETLREQPLWRRMRSQVGASACTVKTADGERYFLRGIAPVPVPELDDSFRWGIWVEVPREQFESAMERWDDPEPSGEYRGIIDTDLPDYPPLRGVPAMMREQGQGVVPAIEVLDGDHPLAREQREGIPVARADELAAPYFHN